MLDLQTHLIIEDGLPQIFKEPRNMTVGSNKVARLLWFRFFRQGPQLPCNLLEFAGINLAKNKV